MRFICKPCKKGADLDNATDPMLIPAQKYWHKNCKGNTWCDCQHRLKK